MMRVGALALRRSSSNEVSRNGARWLIAQVSSMPSWLNCAAAATRVLVSLRPTMATSAPSAARACASRQADAVGRARDQDVLAPHEVPRAKRWRYAAFHLMEQPTEGNCSDGVAPAAIARMASTSSRRAVAGIEVVRPSSRRPRYLSLRSLS
jgi:hypothetical protein